AMVVVALCFAALGGQGGLGGAAIAQQRLVATAISIDAATPTRTVVRVNLTRRVKPRVFTLPEPNRAVVDIRGLRFAFPDGSRQVSGGLVRAFRYGTVGPGRARMVFDLTGRVDTDVAVTRGRGGWQVVLTLDGKAGGPAPRAVGLRPGSFESGKVTARRETDTPVIVIDPGHGGIDPGAVAPDGLYEKTIVLEVAKRLRNKLHASGRYKVVMTRATDVYLTLDRRAEIAAEAGASLFISLHADSIANKEAAKTVRGATIYTLAEKASDRHAQEIADKENAADRFSGQESRAPVAAPEVRSILFDLVRRESANLSAQFRERLISGLKSRIRMARHPRRSAAFRVLKQLQTPAVLLELGFISNPQDRRLMRTKAWQKKFAEGVKQAANRHFAAIRRAHR
ncbi:MAG: N-acetylmuramoyl-L-alanine amidase, partial [Pseudomonadota bacterium]